MTPDDCLQGGGSTKLMGFDLSRSNLLSAYLTTCR
jgi:hypothetical protein